jgi:hypothetical protein
VAVGAVTVVPALATLHPHAYGESGGMSQSRRYEILLPLKFNDGQPVPWTLMNETVEELQQRFGAVSPETQIIQGTCRFGGNEMRDELVRVFIDVADTPEHRQFFRELKERLKTRFRQIDIWMTTYPIEVV